MRSHPNKPSNRRTHSIANPTAFTSPADAPKVDKRLPNVGHGQQGLLVCPECATLQSTVKVSNNILDRETKEFLRVENGDLLIRRHTPEGKTFRPRAGDTICKGSMMPI